MLSKGDSRPQLSQASSGNTRAHMPPRLGVWHCSIPPSSSQESQSAKLREEGLMGEVTKVHGLEPMAVPNLSTEWRVTGHREAIVCPKTAFCKTKSPTNTGTRGRLLQSCEVLLHLLLEGAESRSPSFL